MNLNLIITGIFILIILFIAGVKIILKQGSDMTLLLSSAGRKIREATRRVKEIELINPDDLSETDRKNLEKLKDTIDRLNITQK